MSASRIASALLVVAQALFWIAVLLWLPAATLTSVFWGWGTALSGVLGTRTFLSALLFLVPGLAVLGYLNGSGWARVGKAIALSGIGVASMALARAIAVSFYPQYPKQGPHEWVAAATILPAVALPAAVIARWQRLGMSARSWMLYAAWSVLVLGTTFAIFERKMETALPLSVTRVTRWERIDIQDYEHYFVRADGIELKVAERYAADLGLTKSPALPDAQHLAGAGERLVGAPGQDTFGCDPEDDAEVATESEWKLPQQAKVWGRDDRVREGDTDKYPSGLSGCFTRAAWGAQTLLVCRICDWGI